MKMTVVPSLARFGRYTFFHSFDSSLLLRVDFIYTPICYILLLFGYVDVSCLHPTLGLLQATYKF